MLLAFFLCIAHDALKRATLEIESYSSPPSPLSYSFTPPNRKKPRVLFLLKNTCEKRARIKNFEKISDVKNPTKKIEKSHNYGTKKKNKKKLQSP